MAGPSLRVIDGGAVPVGPPPADPWEFQAECVEAFVASWRARGFSPVTIDNDTGLLERTLAALGRPAWEVTPEDIDRVVGELAVAGRAASTRREYVQIFKGFHRFLQARKAVEIEAAFGVRLVCPVDEFNASRHVGDDSAAVLPPPTPERVSEFFEFLKTRIATARKYAPAARDYALFRTLYHAGLRSEEAALLERCGRALRPGPVRQAARAVRQGRADTPGRGRGGCRCWTGWTWCCAGSARMCAAKFPDSSVLFADESGGAAASGDDPQPAAVSARAGGPPAGRAVQPACAAAGVRDAQLRARRGPGRDPAAARALDGELDDAVCPPVGDVHRGRLPARGDHHVDRADRGGVTDADPVAAADGRGPARGVDRHPAAPAAGRAGRAGAVLGVGVGAVRPRSPRR